MVRKAGLEPACLSAPPPQDGVSANSTTSAQARIFAIRQKFIIAKWMFGTERSHSRWGHPEGPRFRPRAEGSRTNGPRSVDLIRKR